MLGLDDDWIKEYEKYNSIDRKSLRYKYKEMKKKK